MLEHLGDHHEQSRGGRLFRQDRAEVDADGLGPIQQRVDAIQIRDAVARVVRRVVQVGGAAQRIVKLRGIEPHVDARHAEPGVGQDCPEREQPAAQWPGLRIPQGPLQMIGQIISLTGQPARRTVDHAPCDFADLGAHRCRVLAEHAGKSVRGGVRLPQGLPEQRFE